MMFCFRFIRKIAIYEYQFDDKYGSLQFVICININQMYIDQSVWKSFCKVVKENKNTIGKGIAIAAVLLLYLHYRYNSKEKIIVQTSLLSIISNSNKSQITQEIEETYIKKFRSQINSLPHPSQETLLTEPEKNKLRSKSSIVNICNQNNSLQVPTKQQVSSKQTSSIRTSQFKREYDNLLCCISQELLKEPYSIACCGNEFEKEKIIESIQRYGKCPLCRKTVTVNDLQFREKTKQFVEAFKQKALRKGQKWCKAKGIDFQREILNR